MTRASRSGGAPIPPGQPRAPLSVAVGWVCIGFAPLPLAVGLHGDGAGYLTAAAVLLGCGAVLVLVGRRGTHT